MIGMTPVKKIEYVTETLLPMLRNDLAVVVESGCEKHGCGSGPQFTLAFLCLLACEVVGTLDSQTADTTWKATRAFIARVGVLANDPRYAQFAGLLFALFRNGIGHSFLPMQCQELGGTAVWISGCVHELRKPENETQLHNHRVSGHLVVRRRRERRSFDIVTKILYIDIDSAIVDFGERLARVDKTGTAEFVRAFDRWVRDNQRLKSEKILTAREIAFLRPGAPRA